MIPPGTPAAMAMINSWFAELGDAVVVSDGVEFPVIEKFWADNYMLYKATEMLTSYSTISWNGKDLHNGRWSDSSTNDINWYGDVYLVPWVFKCEV